MYKSEQTSFELIESLTSAATPHLAPLVNSGYQVCTAEYVISGKGYLEECGQKWLLEKDDVYLLRKGENNRYYQEPSDPWNKLFFIVNGTLMEELVANCLAPGECVFRHCGKLFHYFETFLAMAQSPHTRELDIKAALLFHNLLCDLRKNSEAAPAAGAGPEFRLKDQLERSIGSEFRLKEYAEASGFSKSYLIRRFRAAFGQTPGDYLLSLRIARAENLLRCTPLRIKEIADRLHFADQSAFTHCFRQRTGISPKNYRVQAQTGP